MVKVMQFAVSQGKVAVHCHAGRGEYKSLGARWQYIVMLVEVLVSQDKVAVHCHAGRGEY